MRKCISVAWVLTTLFTSLGFVGAQPSTTSDSGFVKSQGGKFTLDGKPFHYVGTNAYWLQLLNKKDLNKTMHDIAALGIKVVRTWAFNDVDEIPEDGVWFQVLHDNGTIEVNMGENGLVRLDNIVKAAKDNNLHVLFSLTNNWFRNATGTTDSGVQNSKRDGSTPVNRRKLPRNFLSNDYGGMDVYNRQFHKNVTNLFHDPFYTKPDILAAFSRYVAKIVKRYANEPSVLGWELANDPRCASSLPAANGCTPQTITKWTATIAAVVKQNDPNHLVSTGDAGFYCTGCPKVFPHVPTPAPSPAFGRRRRRRRGYLTEADLRKLFAKRAKMGFGVRESQDKSKFRQVRGNWYAPKDAVRKRQTNTFGDNFDGSFGVDTEDLANAPGIDFSSLQFFPDQNTFGGAIDLNDIDSITQNGVDWINLHADTANTFGQPVTVSSFGLLTEESQNTFSPFNATQESNDVHVSTTQEEQVQAYDTIFEASDNAGVNIIHYQWGQDNLTASAEGPIRPKDSSTTTSSTSTENTIGTSPDDGYATYQDSPIRASIAGAADLFASAGAAVKVKPRMDL